MYRLKLMAARSYVKAVTASLNPISDNPSDSLKLSAQVHGLGPVFRLVLELQNNNAGKAVMNMFIAFHCDDRIYDIETNHIPVPYLVPGFMYHFDTKVRCISPMNTADTIKVCMWIFVCDHKSRQDYLCATGVRTKGGGIYPNPDSNDQHACQRS